MSTPRLPAPRSRPAPMIATGSSGLSSGIGERLRRSGRRRPDQGVDELHGPLVANAQLSLRRRGELDAERLELRARNQVVEGSGEAIQPGRQPAGSEMV